MTQDQDAKSAQAPESFQEYSDARFGFRVMMPKRFEVLPTTVDLLSRMIRGLDELPPEEQKQMQGSLPVGFWDPAVIGHRENGVAQPLRLIEFDALRGGEMPLPEENSARLWREVRDFIPKTLESVRLPGYTFLGLEETTLGSLPALAFDYSWDGIRPGHYGGDRARVIWSLTPVMMLQVYHHCSGEEWEARLPEFESILATFELLPEEVVEKEAARSALAMEAFNAAKEAGSSDEDARAAAQAAYEAAGEDSAAAEEAGSGDATDDARSDDVAPEEAGDAGA